MTTPTLRPSLIRTLTRLADLLQRVEHPTRFTLYEGLGLGQSRSALLLKELRDLGLVDRTRSPGHIWITEAGRDLLARLAEAKDLAQRHEAASR